MSAIPRDHVLQKFNNIGKVVDNVLWTGGLELIDRPDFPFEIMVHVFRPSEITEYPLNLTRDFFAGEIRP